MSTRTPPASAPPLRKLSPARYNNARYPLYPLRNLPRLHSLGVHPESSRLTANIYTAAVTYLIFTVSDISFFTSCHGKIASHCTSGRGSVSVLKLSWVDHGRIILRRMFWIRLSLDFRDDCNSPRILLLYRVFTNFETITSVFKGAAKVERDYTNRSKFHRRGS